MIDNNLTTLIENIEDKLQKHILDAISSVHIKRGKTKRLIITPLDKTYPADTTTDQILNDPDNIIIDVKPQQDIALPNESILLPKVKQEEIINRMVVAYRTIQSIKNNIMSLRYSDKQKSQDIVNDLLKDKASILSSLESVLANSTIFNLEFQEYRTELISMIKKLNNEIISVQSINQSNTPPSTSGNNKMKASYEGMEAKEYKYSPELQKILDDVITAEKESNPYWPTNAPFSSLSKDDEDMDALLMAGKFEINACLTSYYREIKYYNVDELLNKIGIGAKGLFEILNNLCGGIKDNTDRPVYVQNTITDIIKYFDDYQGCGQVIQILILQGLLSWFENSDLNEENKGYRETEDLCGWVGNQCVKVCVFYFRHFNKDKNSKPLDDYLASTEIGKAWDRFSLRSTEDASKDKGIPADENDSKTKEILKNKEDSANSFPSCLLTLKSNECRYLYNELTKNDYFLSKETNQNHFNYVFGGGVCPDDFAPLGWNKSKQAIAELILLLLKKTSIPRKTQRDASILFIIKKKLIGSLSNPKKNEYSNDYGVLETIVQAINSRSS